jgi:hypothetical protein
VPAVTRAVASGDRGLGVPYHGTKFSLTKISLFDERLKFQAPLTKEVLKLVSGLKHFSKRNPTELCFSFLSSFNLIHICSMPIYWLQREKKEREEER